MKKKQDLQDLAIQVNSRIFNVLKVIEETSELNELLAKCLTKTGKDVPETSKVIEELGDTIVRCKILSRMLGDSEVEARIKFKEDMLYKHYLDKDESIKKDIRIKTK